ncbi:hypothetical protein BS78_03G418800 [Paspalum vaginatum]|nr:hypothetical protein BS78_03G418800 [Paspalum vaginatum]
MSSSIQHMEDEEELRHQAAAGVSSSVVAVLDDDDDVRRKNNIEEYYYWPPPASGGGEEELLMIELLEEAEGVSMVNKLISTVYSGPTISDIESALSFTGGGHAQLADDSSAPADPHSAPRKHGNSAAAAVVLSPPVDPEKVVMSRTMENKYTLKMKTTSCNGGLAEDGYKWRKYGQKSIKNSPNPRSYYRCTNPRCNAKKQVERATDEADTLLVTYEGLHLHYTYSHFLHSQAQAQATKKPKIHPRVAGPAQDMINSSPLIMPPAAANDCSFNDASCFVFQYQQPQEAPPAGDQDADYTGVIHQIQEQRPPPPMTNSGGLLEDVVRPLLARWQRPAAACSSSSTSGGATTSSSPSPSLPMSPSAVSWNNNPTSPYYMDMGAILSNIF